ncbi:unnamed protein product [Pleuronectes platessa]|uniref:Uncharacterized protein n=1 Tax=Pleuronectes platessa TaxID=8262 RepID=A0A9N7TV22_PLEPL|nr:unnamed protein product [Pleuronectes platessa]
MPFKDDYTWIPCFGHNLHLAVNKAINIDRVSAALTRLYRTLSAFTRDKEDDSVLTGEMKSLVRESINQRYGNREVQLLLNTATYLDPRFKASFVALEDDMKQSLLEQVGNADDGAAIQGEKKGRDDDTSSQAGLSTQEKLNGEVLVYSKMPELSTDEDPLI